MGELHRPVAPQVSADDNPRMLIGRERELAELETRLENQRIVAVLGEAGVGKTVLIREAARRSGRRLMEGGGLATLKWLPYLAVERALGRRLSSGDAAWVAGEVERAVGDGLLLLDDLHWIDPETRVLLHLLRGRIRIATAVRRGDGDTKAALAVLRALDVDPMAVEPLAESDSRAFVEQLKPELSEAAVRKVVRRSGGVPLLLEELASTGEPTESLRLSVLARLRQLTPAARRSFGLLALAGRPLPPDAIRGNVRTLTDAGLVVRIDGDVACRHALLAETLAEDLDEADRRRLHERLAGVVRLPGERARHLAAAGLPDRARAAALEAAEAAQHEAEKGRHLAIAASCSRGAEADALRLRAARALVESHDHSGVEELLAEIDTREPLVRAEVELLRCEMLVVAMNFPAARAAWRRAMDLADGTGTEVETRLRVEAGRMAFLVDFDPRAVEIAQAGYELAQRRRHHQLVARYVLGSALLHAKDPRWRETLEGVLTAARRARAYSIEYRATNNLVMGLVGSGHLAEARAVALRAQSRARDRRALRWSERMAVWLVAIDWHCGAVRAAVEAGEALVENVSEPLDRLLAAKWVGHALVDVGRLPRARELADEAVRRVRPLHEAKHDAVSEVLGEAYTILARVDYREGRTRMALETAERAAKLYAPTTVSDTMDLATLVAAWCRFDLGMSISRPRATSARALSPPARAEIEALWAISRGRHDEGADRFARAARVWRRRSFGGFLRCLRGQGEALRLAGWASEAIAVLEEAERLAQTHGYAGEHAAIARSLRLSGVRRAARRGPRTPTGLTPREHEILALVAEGLSNDQIARSLGIGRPTVARLIRNASQKLGAATRGQAAVLAAGR